MKTIQRELQHRLVIADLDKRTVKMSVRKGMDEGRKVGKLRERETRAKF